MGRTRKNVTTAIAAIIAVLAIPLWLLREGNKAAQYSCLASIANELSRESPPQPLSREWRVLSDLEAAALLSKIVPYDCPAKTRTATRRNGTLLDSWGRQFKIALRLGDNGEMEIRVWSMGRDGASGTTDDFVMPWGEKAISP